MSVTHTPEVNAYIANADEPSRGRLTTLRGVIGAAAPDATERIGYGMPTWRQGENLVHIGAHTKHVGFYPGPEAIEAFADALAEWPTSKGAVQLPHDRPLPLDLVRRIVEWRVEAARMKAAEKAARKKARAAARRAARRG